MVAPFSTLTKAMAYVCVTTISLLLLQNVTKAGLLPEILCSERSTDGGACLE